MKIAELFVDLGVKGDGAAGKALKNTKGSMDDLFSSSLAVKAALAGVMYGLQQLMSSSASMGAGLSNFNALTGISAQKLQQWQYAARQVGVSNEELAGSFKAVQNSVTNMLLGKGAPEGYAMIANKVGLDQNKVRDIEYMMNKFQEFAQKVPPDVGNQMLKSFGLGDGTIAAMRKNAFNPKAFAAAPAYSDQQIDKLGKVNAAWSNLGTKIEMAIGNFTAKHGMTMVRDLSRITDSVIKLTDALIKLAEKAKVFGLVGQSLDGWTKILNGDLAKDFKAANKEDGYLKGIYQAFQGMKIEQEEEMQKQMQKSLQDMNENPGWLTQYINSKNAATPTTQTININQNLNFQHDGKDAQKTGESVNKAARDAVRTMQSQKQVN